LNYVFKFRSFAIFQVYPSSSSQIHQQHHLSPLKKQERDIRLQTTREKEFRLRSPPRDHYHLKERDIEVNQPQVY
jgi:hypothetical protein